jgi:hypothetical protein
MSAQLPGLHSAELPGEYGFYTADDSCAVGPTFRVNLTGLTAYPDEQRQRSCSTCEGAGYVDVEGQVGTPGLGGRFTCPDCGPALVERIEVLDA